MRRIPGIADAQERPRCLYSSGVKPSKSDPYACFALYRAGFDIRPIEVHHATPPQPSRSSGDDGDASRFPLPGA